MALFVSAKGTKKLAESIDELYGEHIVTVKKNGNSWFVLIGEGTPKVFTRVSEVTFYLEGIKQGLELSKDNI